MRERPPTVRIFCPYCAEMHTHRAADLLTGRVAHRVALCVRETPASTVDHYLYLEARRDA